MNKYIYLSNGESRKKLNIFHDLEQLPNFQLIEVKKDQKNIIRLSRDDNYTIIIMPTLFYICDIDEIKKLKIKKNVKLALIILDTIGLDSPTSRITSKIFKDKIWDYVFTYDKDDSQKYDLIYLDEHYYSIPNIKNKNKKLKDAYYAGALKPGRTSELAELFSVLKANNLNVEFDITEKDGRKIDFYDKKFNIHKRSISYKKVLKNTISSNCIIEFLQKNQYSPSLRYYEAVVFNKKLLTNNKNVKQLQFYDEKYMRFFENIQDIDFEWVKRREHIDYGYNNEFSPIWIIKKIEEIENEK